MVRRGGVRRPKKKTGVIKPKAPREPKEITDMQKLVMGFQSAIQSGRMTHILSTKRNFAEVGDFFSFESEDAPTQRFVFISGPKSVTLDFAKNVLFHMLGYMSPMDFERGTSMIMDGWKPSKKMFLFGFVPSVETEKGNIQVAHRCKYLHPDLSIWQTEEGHFMLHHRGFDEKAEYTLDASVRVYNCPGCRAVLQAVLE